MTEAIKNEVRQRTIFLLQKRDEANEEERNKIIAEIAEENISYIEGYVVKRFSSFGTEVVQELISECTIAFMKAMNTYIINDISLYSTYAKFFFNNAVYEYFRKEKGIKAASQQSISVLKNCIKKLNIDEDDVMIHIPQLMEELGWSEQRIKNTYYTMALQYVVYDFSQEDEGNITELSEFTEEIAISNVTSAEIRDIVKRILTPRKLAILDAKYDMGFFPEIQEMKKKMTTTDALNLYLGENHTSKYYCAMMITFVLIVIHLSTSSAIISTYTRYITLTFITCNVIFDTIFFKFLLFFACYSWKHIINPLFLYHIESEITETCLIR